MTLSPNCYDIEKTHIVSLAAANAVTRKTLRYLRIRAECGMWRARRDGDDWLIDLSALLDDLDDDRERRGAGALRRRSERPWLRLVVDNDRDDSDA